MVGLASFVGVACVLIQCEFGQFQLHMNLNAQNGYTVLIVSTWNGETDCLRFVLDAGADTNAKDSVRF